MPLTPALPAPLLKGAKVLIKSAEAVIPPALALYDYITSPTAVADLQWRYIVLRWTRASPSGTVEDVAQVGFNVTNITGGDLDITWTQADYDQVVSHLNELWLGIKQFVSTGHTLTDARFYVRSFRVPMTPDQRFNFSGPPAFLHQFSDPGSNSGLVLPYQTSMSITFKTPAPRHWGRVYLPGMTATSLSATNGRIDTAVAGSLAQHFAEFKDDLEGSQFQLVVPTTQINKVLTPALQTVTAIQVDDIPDVVRRRRARQPALRSIGVPIP